VLTQFGIKRHQSCVGPARQCGVGDRQCAPIRHRDDARRDKCGPAPPDQCTLEQLRMSMAWHQHAQKRQIGRKRVCSNPRAADYFGRDDIPKCGRCGDQRGFMQHTECSVRLDLLRAMATLIVDIVTCAALPSRDIEILVRKEQNDGFRVFPTGLRRIFSSKNLKFIFGRHFWQK